MEILKMKGAKKPYLTWSMKEGKPLSDGMTEEELREEYGKTPSFERKLMRANERGCSSFEYPLDYLMDFNCAGPGGECLSREGIIKNYRCNA